jgi:hypothetical protein
MFKRLFPSRWARILAWTGAALAWGTTAIGVQAANAPANENVDTDPLPPQVEEVTTPTAAVPNQPEKGLVVIRYTPVPPPPPQVIVRTVTTPGKTTVGGGGAPSTGGGSSSSRPTVKSSGS